MGRDGGVRKPELVSDLVVGEPAPLPHDEGPPLHLRKPRERAREPEELVGQGVRPGREELALVERPGPDTGGGRPAARDDEVSGDPLEPGIGPLGAEPALQAAPGVEVGVLDDVLGLLVRAELALAVGEEPGPVAAV